MKFQKELAEIITTLKDPVLSQSCIPYKKWKKVVKYRQLPWSFKDLEQQCQQVDKTFTTHVSMMHKKPLHIPCGLSLCFIHKTSILPDRETQNDMPKDLITYASINAQAVYKVCKKLEKSGFPGAMKFLENLRNSHKYVFLGSHITTQLRLDNPLDKNIDRSCPICFEDLSIERPAIILPCGHYQCCSCLKDMTHIDKIRGTLTNRLAIVAIHFKCPICRYCNHLNSLRDRYTFWPCKPTASQL